MLVVIYCNRSFFHHLLFQGEEVHSGEPLISQADPTTKGLEQNKADASTATSEHLGRPEQDEGYVARCSELVVGHTHRLPKLTDADKLVTGVDMIQLSESFKLSLCI